MATISLSDLIRIRDTALKGRDGTYDLDAILNREIYPAFKQLRRILIEIVDNVQPVDITPDTLASSQNNYSPTGHAGTTYARLSASVPVNITGFLASDFAYPFWEKTYRNVGAQEITVTNEDAGSDPENRLTIQGGLNLVVRPNDTLTLRYDFTSQRLVVV